ncbi:hypothetical protein BJX99DRAFT_217896 [Aspergillus californicus]
MAGAALRHRLHSLWTSLTDPRMDWHLESENAVSSRFLMNNNITLTMHAFSVLNTKAENLNKKPPVLFLLRPPSIINEHPIDLNGELFRVADDPSPANQMEKIFSDAEDTFYYSGESLAHYIQAWAMYSYPRHLPPGCPNLATLCNIQAIAAPHAFNMETRGFTRSSHRVNIQWQTRVYEYINTRPNGSTFYPHIILLGVQSCNGGAESISLGELTSIVTAMRCRAHQPAAFDEGPILAGDAEQSEDGDPEPAREDKLAFRNERRFPVIMVSLVGPHHVRIIYACMDGLRLSIRVSGCHEIQATDDMMSKIAAVLLSSPLVEHT